MIFAIEAPPGLWLGGLGLALLSAAVILSRRPQRRSIASAAALLVATGLVATDNWDTERFVGLRASPVLVALAAIVASAAVVALARCFVARPAMVAYAIVAALPFRIPISVGEGTVHLLVPLYLVIAAGVVAQFHPDRAAPRSAAPGPARRIDTVVALVLAASVVIYAVQGAYSVDYRSALDNLAFFFAPFSVAFVLLRDYPWTPRRLRNVAMILIAGALVFTAIAAAQLLTHQTFFNDKLRLGNEVHTWFRVNSLFFDPNIFGRYLAVAMLVAASIVAFTANRRSRSLAAGAFLIGLVGLTMSYSQSSGISLLAGLAVIAGLRWQWRGVAAALAVVAIGLAAAALAAGPAAGDEFTAGRSLDDQTTGRVTLVSVGIDLFRAEPLAGHGAGSFAAEFRAAAGGGQGVAVVSHTEPITVAAEQGLIGLAVYGGLLLGLGRLLVWPLFGAAASRFRADPEQPLEFGIARCAVVAALSAMVVHSLVYAAFLTDPITWALCALAIALIERGFPSLPKAAAPP